MDRTFDEPLPVEQHAEPLMGLSRGLAFLLIGAPVAFAFTLPIVRYMGWFLASLVHEMGHCLAAWLCGCPAFPAIRLDGHAAAIHGEPHSWLAGMIALGFLATSAHLFRSGMRVLPAFGAAIGLLLPLFAFTEAREVLFLSMGHGGELIFAGLCFHRALSGGFSHHDGERLLYAAVGWYLIGRNVSLFFGLWTSATARDAYHGNGSFGMENDLIRLAHDLGWTLPSVGLLFLLGAIVSPLLGMSLGRAVQREF